MEPRRAQAGNVFEVIDLADPRLADYRDIRDRGLLGRDYRLQYNHRRPHSSLEYLTPAAFAAKSAEATALRALSKPMNTP